MAPGLNHRKTRSGCRRCRIRKVKCDEIKPKCSACARHNVDCEYPVKPLGLEGGHSDEILNLRLLHHWTAHVSGTLSTNAEFWRYEAPILGFKFRFVLDGLFALSALHLSKRGPGGWSITGEAKQPMVSWTFFKEHQTSAGPDERAVSVYNPDRDLMQHPLSDTISGFTIDGQDPLELSRRYFARALEGHRTACTAMDEYSAKALFICSVVISCYAVFTLNMDDDDDMEGFEPSSVKWFMIAKGSQPLASRWYEFIGDDWALKAGTMYGEPDMTDDGVLFHPKNREAFNYLLEPVANDSVAEEDREAYERTLSYIGLMHKGITQRLDPPLGTMRRVIAMPSRVPRRYAELVEAKRPRAIAMFIHFFALMHLAEDCCPWLRGVAKRQVPKLGGLLPHEWAPKLQWPINIVGC